jgi:hypothetical protein
MFFDGVVKQEASPSAIVFVGISVGMNATIA